MHVLGMGLRRLVLLAALCVAALALLQHDAKAAAPVDIAQYENCFCVGPVDSQYTWAQTFTAGATGALVQVDLPVFHQPDLSYGEPADLIVEIRAVEAGVPTGPVLASENVPYSALPAYCCSVPYTPVTFSSPAPSVAGTQYAIVLRSSISCPDPYGYGYSNCYYGWMAAIPASHAGGNAWRYDADNGWIFAAPGMGFITHVATDVTAPVVTTPGDLTVNATSAAGAVVTFAASAVDETDGSVATTCTATSGSAFAIGTTAVSCTATDAAGNEGSASFTITVVGASGQLENLAAAVTGVGPGRSFSAQVAGIRAALAAGQTARACSALNAFRNHVRAQSGKSISATTATGLIADAIRIGAVVGC